MGKLPMRIGQLARETGASVRSIRHYDSRGLLSSWRTDNSYRVFPEIAITQVRQIRRLLDSGFNLEEIATFPECMRHKEDAAFCPETIAAQRERLAEIEKRIACLQSAQAQLIRSIAESEEAVS